MKIHGNYSMGNPRRVSIFLEEKGLEFPSKRPGPTMGQANMFYRLFPEKLPAAIARFHNEGRRLIEVLDRQLAKGDWLAGDYSIADIANWCWIRTYRWSGIDVEGLDNLHRWSERMEARPAVQKGVRVPVYVDVTVDTEEFWEIARKAVLQR